MNIQQALNQALVAAGTSVYLAGHTIEQGKQSARAEYQAASDATLEHDKKYNEELGPKIEEWKRRGLSNKEIQAAIEATPIGQEGPIIQNRLDRAERNLYKWDWDREDADNLVDLHYARFGKQEADMYKDAFNEGVALIKQRQQQKTYTNQKQAMDKRIDMLKSGSYKSRMHQPSISKEE